MINEEILGGLKTALEKGESMKRAMMTFFNAGYNKVEIEEAARALSEIHVETSLTIPTAQPLQLTSAAGAAPSAQKVSGYGEKKNRTKLIIIVISLIILLIGLLVTIFIFRDKLTNLF